MKQEVVLAITMTFLLASCKQSENKVAGADNSTSCRGVYYERSITGQLLKYDESYNKSMNQCLSVPQNLTYWEESKDAWDRNARTCSPVTAMASVTLIASNNYYDFKNGRIYLSLNASTGQVRRITIGQDAQGATVYARDLGCWYQRTDLEAEPVNPQDYGDQLLLDFAASPSTNPNPVAEIYRYQRVGSDWFMTSFDNTADWDFSFCPNLWTPWQYCSKLRNGNQIYYPNLTAQEQSDLLLEAKLIRTQFNFTQITDGAFDSLWEQMDQSDSEKPMADWLYWSRPLAPDTPPNTWLAWARYIQRSPLQQTMPDVASPQMPPVCYDGKKQIALADGTSGYISGEICYVNGSYEFTNY